jgi:hypothetical protein
VGESKLILGVPGVGAGLLARESVEWLLDADAGLGGVQVLLEELNRFLERPLPGSFFGVAAVRDDELAAFRMLVQRAGWAFGAPEDVKALQLAVARGEGERTGDGAPAGHGDAT